MPYTHLYSATLLVEKAGVTPDVTFRITACKQERVQVRYPLWIWNPWGRTHEVQNRSNQWLHKMDHGPDKKFKKKEKKKEVLWIGRGCKGERLQGQKGARARGWEGARVSGCKVWGFSADTFPVTAICSHPQTHPQPFLSRLHGSTASTDEPPREIFTTWYFYFLHSDDFGTGLTGASGTLW